MTYIYVILKFDVYLLQILKLHGTIKTELFDIELQKNAELFKAMSHPARLAILKYLAETRPALQVILLKIAIKPNYGQSAFKRTKKGWSCSGYY